MNLFIIPVTVNALETNEVGVHSSGQFALHSPVINPANAFHGLLETSCAVVVDSRNGSIVVLRK